MAQTERRTLEIVAKVQDLASAQLGKIGKSFTTMASTAGDAFKRLRGHIATAKGAVDGFLAVLGIRGVKSVIDFADSLKDTAAATGISVEKLSAFQFVLRQTGVEAGKANSVIERLNLAAGKALLGDRETGGAFASLGISRAQLEQGDATALFVRIASGMERFRTAAERAAVANAIFGKGVATEVLPSLAEGGAELERVRKEAETWGAVISEKTTKAADDFNDSLDKLTTAAKGALLQGIAPLLDGFARAVNSQTGVDTVAGGMRLLGEAVGSLTGALVKAATAASDFYDAVLRETGISGLIEHAKAVERDAEAIDKLLAASKRLNSFTRVGGKLVNADPSATRIFDARAEGFLPRTERDESIRQQTIALAQALQQAFTGRGVAAGFAGIGGIRVPQNREGEQFDLPFARDLTDEEAFGFDETRRMSFINGLKDGIEELKFEFSDFRNQAIASVVAIGNSIVDNLTTAIADVVTGVKTLKEAFAEFGKALLRQLVEIIVKLVIVRALSSILGTPQYNINAGGGSVVAAAKGGIVSGEMGTPIPIRSYAQGGIANSPQLAVFGEGRSAEAFVPLPDGRSIPVTMSGGGGTTIIHYHINAIDAASSAQWIKAHGTALAAEHSRQLGSNRRLREDHRAVR